MVMMIGILKDLVFSMWRIKLYMFSRIMLMFLVVYE